MKGDRAGGNNIDHSKEVQSWLEMRKRGGGMGLEMSRMLHSSIWSIPSPCDSSSLGYAGSLCSELNFQVVGTIPNLTIFHNHLLASKAEENMAKGDGGAVGWSWPSRGRLKLAEKQKEAWGN
ncbi:hypothetical protein BY996DRAFT_6621170 [Phakopsora pachyrhizi]|uniref:Uncharacterized protein n=1 Tax=Phakopsora pachyrhizi TaxID=170000 RepID=A0AAV0AZY7_PHAPC|nr:hypothetical protein BY996DRAFT_6621170 [Phakopsora pachyrhizi]CAH7676020.1 hypothetical protein PPACK8108_LOCUS11120 [Phakopsora pachyrhizi]